MREGRTGSQGSTCKPLLDRTKGSVVHLFTIFIINPETAECLDYSCKAGQRYLIGLFNSFTFDCIKSYLDKWAMSSFVIYVISIALWSTSSVGRLSTVACFKFKNITYLYCLLIIYKTDFIFMSVCRP